MASGLGCIRYKSERGLDLEVDLFGRVFFREEFGSFLLGDFFREFLELAAGAVEEAFAFPSVRPAGFLFCFLVSLGLARWLEDFFDEAPVGLDRPRWEFFCRVRREMVFCICASLRSIFLVDLSDSLRINSLRSWRSAGVSASRAIAVASVLSVSEYVVFSFRSWSWMSFLVTTSW